jgi:hypothetical protein
MNILFIMYDQLRFDYLSCAGHPHLHTPNFDRLAEMGVRFSEAYVQSPICGASRMSFYTGRYASSHGAQWNGFPLRVGEVTLGDHLRKLGMESWLLGKTHMKVDAEGMARLGLSPDRSSAHDSPNAASTPLSGMTDCGARGRTASTIPSALPTMNISSPRAMTATTPGRTTPMPVWTRTATSRQRLDVHECRQAGQHSRGRQRNPVADLRDHALS